MYKGTSVTNTNKLYLGQIIESEIMASYLTHLHHMTPKTHWELIKHPTNSLKLVPKALLLTPKTDHIDELKTIKATQASKP